MPSKITELPACGKECTVYHNEATRALVASGINFFAAAPLDAVRALKEPFDRLVSYPGARIEPFSFMFWFAWGNREATFTMVRRSEDLLYIVITDKPVVGLAA